MRKIKNVIRKLLKIMGLYKDEYEIAMDVETQKAQSLTIYSISYIFSLVLFVIGSDLYIVAPLLNNIRENLHASLSDAGLLVTVFGALYAISSPFIGWFTDKFGRRIVLYGGLACFIIFEVISAFTFTIQQLLVARGLTAIAAASISPTLYTVLGDIIPYKSRGRAISIASVGFSTANIAGVPLGIWLSQFYGWRGVMALLGVAASISGIFMGISLERLNAFKNSKLINQNKGQHVLSSIKVLLNPVFFASFFAFMTIGLVYTYLSVELQRRFLISLKIIGWILLIYGISNLLGNLYFGSLGDKIGKRKAAQIAQFIEAISLLLIILLFTKKFYYPLIIILWIFSFGQAYIPNLKAMASSVSTEIRGQNMAWNNSAMYGGLMLGSWIATRIYTSVDFSILVLLGILSIFLGFLSLYIYKNIY